MKLIDFHTHIYPDAIALKATQSIEKGSELVSLFGEDRVLFAGDFPAGSPVTERENLMRLDISDDAKEKIAYKNAERLLGLSL